MTIATVGLLLATFTALMGLFLVSAAVMDALEAWWRAR
jgi:hypothetical protein